MAKLRVETDNGAVYIDFGGAIPTDMATRNRIADEKLSAGDFEPVVEPAMTLAKRAGHMAVSGGPAALGQLGGATLGPVGAMAGGMAGEALTQFVDPFQTGASQSPLGDKAAAILMAGLVPPGGAAARGAIRSTARGIPGIEGGLQASLQNRIGPEGANLIDTVPAGPLWERAKAAGQGLKIGTVATGKALYSLRQELDNIVPELRPQADRVVRGLEKIMVPAGPGGGAVHVDLNQFRSNMSALGEEMHSIMANEGTGSGQMKKLYAAMWEDLENFTHNQSGPYGELLKSAVKAQKAESAIDLFGKLLDKSTSFPKGIRNVNAETLTRSFYGNREAFEKLLGRKDVAEITSILQDGARNTPNIPSSGVQRMGSNFSRMLDAMGPNQIEAALLTPAGRRTVRFFMENGHKIERAMGAGLQMSGVPTQIGQGTGRALQSAFGAGEEEQ